MGIETKTKEIGSTTFEVTQLPYFRAQRLFTRLLKLAGPGLLGLAQLAGVNGKAAAGTLLNLDVEKLTPVLAVFFERLEPTLMEDLTREILSGARAKVNGSMVDLLGHMDIIIGGDFWTGLAVQGWALSVHFGNFSGARAALAAAGPPATPSISGT